MFFVNIMTHFIRNKTENVCASEFTPPFFSVVRVARYLVFCAVFFFLDYVCPFSFGYHHYFLFTTSDYPFVTPFVSSNFYFICCKLILSKKNIYIKYDIINYSSVI